jgi:hypothetical protein
MLARAVATKESPSKAATQSSLAPKSPDYFAPVEETQSDFTRPKYSWNFGDIAIAAPRDNTPPNRGRGDRWHAFGLLLQTKLEVGAVDDPLEREADRVAEQVMRMPEPERAANPTSLPVGNRLQRKCSCGGTCEHCQEEPRNDGALKLQKKKLLPDVEASAATFSGVRDVLASPGRPLEAATRDYFEPRFGLDFSRVRVHADAAAAASAQAVNAVAYTVGPHLVMGNGAMSADTVSGRRLIAHELAHVVQQGQGIPLRQENSSSDSPDAGVAALEVPGAAQSRAPQVMLQRTSLLNSTMHICKRVLKGEHTFHVSQGGIIITASASWEPSEDWEGEERPKCDINEFHVTLTQPGRIWDSDYGDCTFPVGRPFSRQWTDLPEEDYRLTIWTNNTYPFCCLAGSVEVSEEKGLTGESCTHPPPGPLEMLHDALNIAGLVPALGAVPDAINAGIYAVEGDWKNAGISAVAMIPVLGEGANVAKLGEKTVLKVSGEAVEKVGAKELGTGWKEVKAAEAAKVAKEAEAAKAAKAIGDEVKLSKEEYEAALKMVFPSQYADPVAKLVDDIGQGAAKRAMANPKFVKAMQDGNMTLAGTYFHTAAKEEARAIPKTALPKGWSLDAELTIQSGKGGSRADLFLTGPGGDLVEFDWKTTGKSALSSGSRKEMATHAGQVIVHKGSALSTQESRSWMDYVRPFL